MDVIENTRIDDVLFVYQQGMEFLSQEIEFTDQAFLLQNEFEWNSTTWELAPPHLSDKERRSRKGMDASGAAVKNAIDFGNGNWEAILKLACVYFRIKGEPYEDALTRVDGARYRLLQSLPLDIAFHIAAYFLSSLNTYIEALQHSKTAAQGVTDGLLVQD